MGVDPTGAGGVQPQQAQTNKPESVTISAKAEATIEANTLITMLQKLEKEGAISQSVAQHLISNLKQDESQGTPQALEAINNLLPEINHATGANFQPLTLSPNESIHGVLEHNMSMLSNAMTTLERHGINVPTNVVQQFNALTEQMQDHNTSLEYVLTQQTALSNEI